MINPIKDLKVFVPAKDFKRSLDFYQKLGWQLNWLKENELAELENGNTRFFLQNYYQKAWANNFMMYIDIDNAQSCYDEINNIIQQNDFGKARINPPKDEGYAIITHVWDPSGVLLHFAQSTESNN